MHVSCLCSWWTLSRQHRPHGSQPSSQPSVFTVSTRTSVSRSLWLLLSVCAAGLSSCTLYQVVCRTCKGQWDSSAGLASTSAAACSVLPTSYVTATTNSLECNTKQQLRRLFDLLHFYVFGLYTRQKTHFWLLLLLFLQILPLQSPKQPYINSHQEFWKPCMVWTRKAHSSLASSSQSINVILVISLFHQISSFYSSFYYL